MYVKNLEVKHYRNYDNVLLSFDPGIHIFIGDNAQGKTNILESLYVLALAKSHRTSKDKELINWDQNYATIKGNIAKKYGDVQLELQISQKGKKAKLNRIEQQRLSDYVGTLNVVMFAPEDLELVKGSPQKRRRFLDMEIIQISSTYLHYVNHYHKILSQRNALLKEWQKKNENRPIIDVFTVQLIDMAAKIYVKRAKYLKQLLEWAKPIHSKITKEKEELHIKYIYSTPITEEMQEEEIVSALTSKYEAIREQEEARGTTLIGPHRDDIQFTINGINVSSFGSQGQQRTTALSLKLAEIELIHDEIGDFPILLLDDVLSELDEERRSHLLQAIQDKVQTFVTNTSIEGIYSNILEKSTIYEVHQGQISLKEG